MSEAHSAQWDNTVSPSCSPGAVWPRHVSPVRGIHCIFNAAHICGKEAMKYLLGLELCSDTFGKDTVTRAGYKINPTVGVNPNISYQ